MTGANATPAEMPGEIERAFNLAARAMQRRFGASGTEEDIEAALSEFFAPILAEKEREIERACADHANATIGWERDRGRADDAEARALAAEAALAAAVEALAPFADEKNGVMQDLLWGDHPDSATMTITFPLGQVRKAREAVRAAAIRAEGE